MAATRIMPIHLNKGGTPAKALSDVIGYVGNPEKTDKGYLISSFHCSRETAAADFMLLRQSLYTIFTDFAMGYKKIHNSQNTKTNQQNNERNNMARKSDKN